MKVVIITGASQGIGYELSGFLASKGMKVYGIARSDFSISNVVSLKGDVTNEEEISSLINHVYEIEGKIDYLINNAGMGISGSVEASSTFDVRRIFEVNFIGTFLTTKYTLPLMRANGCGKILNVGSVASEFSIPFQTFYSSSKAAVKTFSEGLANEVSPYGIGVSVILPGDIKTNFTKNRRKNENEINVYEKRVEKSIGVMEKDEQNGMSTLYASKVIYKTMLRKKMPLVKVIGNKYKVMIFLKRLLPVKLVNKIVGSLYAFKKE